MTISKSPKVKTSDDDNLLYFQILKLLNQIKLVQGGPALNRTLARHPFIKDYCISKQILALDDFEELYFNVDGSLNSLAVSGLADRFKL